MAAAKLTTTSYAILGLLSVAPHSAYDLTRQMERSLAHFWPRARTHLYGEPKRLHRLGLATAAVQWTGRRPRTVYSITEEGRQALGAWLATSSPRPLVECEALVKVFFADNGSLHDLRLTLREMAAQTDATYADMRSKVSEYVENPGPYPERLHLIALASPFIAEYLATFSAWARWADEEVGRWSGTQRPAADVAWNRLVESWDLSAPVARRPATPTRAPRRGSAGGWDRA